MPEMQLKLQHFTNTVLDSAAQELERAKKAMEEKRQAALKEARHQAREQANAYLRQQVTEIQRERGQQVSRHLLDAKRQIFLRRAQIAGEVFEAVDERIGRFTASPQYFPHLEKLLRQALDSFGPVESVKVYLRPADQAAREALIRAAAPVQLEILPGSFTLGGLIVECTQLGRRADASFDTARADLSGHFAELFGLSLADDLAQSN